MSRPVLLALALLAAVLTLAAGAAPAPAAATAATAQTRTVQAGGLRLGFRTIGTGRPLVLIQGLSGTMDAWEPAFVDALARTGRRVVLFDNAGMGRSERRTGTLTIARMADDAAALIAALRLGRADVLGYSMGGMIAQSLAVRHPRRVRRLVLAATAPGDGRATPPTSAAAEALVDPEAGPFRALGLLFPSGAEAARDRYLRGITSRRGAAPTGPAAVRQAQVAASARWLLGRDAAGARVRNLRVPVLVGGGVLDQVLPFANQRRLAQVIPGAQLARYDRAAHGFLFQHAASFVRRVDRFLGRR